MLAFPLDKISTFCVKGSQTLQTQSFFASQSISLDENNTSSAGEGDAELIFHRLTTTRILLKFIWIDKRPARPHLSKPERHLDRPASSESAS